MPTGPGTVARAWWAVLLLDLCGDSGEVRWRPPGGGMRCMGVVGATGRPVVVTGVETDGGGRTDGAGTWTPGADRRQRDKTRQDKTGRVRGRGHVQRGGGVFVAVVVFATGWHDSLVFRGCEKAKPACAAVTPGGKEAETVAVQRGCCRWGHRDDGCFKGARRALLSPGTIQRRRWSKTQPRSR